MADGARLIRRVRAENPALAESNHRRQSHRPPSRDQAPPPKDPVWHHGGIRRSHLLPWNRQFAGDLNHVLLLVDYEFPLTSVQPVNSALAIIRAGILRTRAAP